MKKTACVALIVVGLCLACTGRAAAAPGGAVESVSATLSFTSHTPPEPMVDKIRYSVEQVGVKALKGKTLAEAAELEGELTGLMEKIFNQVLGGYLVREASVEAAPNTQIRITLEPIPPMVQSLDVELDFEGGINSEWNEILAGEREAVRAQLADIFLDVPVLSDRWAEKVLTEMLPGLVDFQNIFPGFSVRPELKIEEQTVLRLHLEAQGELVRMVSVKMRSNTIPSLALEQIKYDAASRSDLLIGLPIGFAESKKGVIADRIRQNLEQSRLANTLGLEMNLDLHIAKRARVLMLVNSRRYSGFLRGKISVGEETHNPDIEAHLGFFTYENIEIFSEFNFYPGPISLDANLGVGWRFNDVLFAGTGIETIEGMRRIWLSLNISEDVIIAWEKGVSEDPKKDIEGSITLRAHEFFSFDLVSDFNTDVWLRFNANL